MPLLAASVVTAVLLVTANAGATTQDPTAAAIVVTGLTDRATAAGLLPTFNNTWAAEPLDYDNDGDQDVWVGYHQQGVLKGTQGGGRLWSNDGDGTYTWVARTRLAADQAERATARSA